LVSAYSGHVDDVDTDSDVNVSCAVSLRSKYLRITSMVRKSKYY